MEIDKEKFQLEQQIDALFTAVEVKQSDILAIHKRLANMFEYYEDEISDLKEDVNTQKQEYKDLKEERDGLQEEVEDYEKRDMYSAYGSYDNIVGIDALDDFFGILEDIPIQHLRDFTARYDKAKNNLTDLL